MPCLAIVIWHFILFYFSWVGLFDAVNILNQSVKTMGANWTFGADACEDRINIMPVVWTDPQRNITCDCGFPNDICHITAMYVSSALLESFQWDCLKQDSFDQIVVWYIHAGVGWSYIGLSEQKLSKFGCNFYLIASYRNAVFFLKILILNN